MAADFEIRRLNLKGARVILGNAIGRAPKGTIFEKYIELEWQLGNVDRVRRITRSTWSGHLKMPLLG